MNQKNTSTVAMFEISLRKKLRWSSSKGDLTLEQLFVDVPLRSKDGFNLNAIAQVTNRSLQALGEENFVGDEKSPEEATAALKLDMVKYVIELKVNEEAAAERAKANKKEIEKLLGILEQKNGEELLGLTPKQLQAKIDKLRNGDADA